LKILCLHTNGVVIYPFDRHIKITNMRIAYKDEDLKDAEDDVMSSRSVQLLFGETDGDCVPFGLNYSPGKTANIIEIAQREQQAVKVQGFEQVEDTHITLTIAVQDVVIFVMNDEGKTVDKITHRSTTIPKPTPPKE